MKNRKGFTLIEIIVCIAILVVVGTVSTVGIVSVTSKKEDKILEQYSEEFETALNVYLASNNNILNSIYNYVEGAVVSLEVLKNEGLIRDDLNIDYENNYFLLSDAVLVSNEEDGSEACNGRVSIETIKSWDLSKYDTSKVIYVCPKDGAVPNTPSITNTNIITNGYVAKGANPNNWVKFEVESRTDDLVHFPGDEEKNLWRILRINDNGEIKLVYNKSISRNESIAQTRYNGSKYTITTFDYKTGYVGMRLYEIIASIPDSDYSKSYIENKTSSNFLSNQYNYAKYFIYQSIINKAWLKKDFYYYYLKHPSAGAFASLSDFNVLNVSMLEYDSKYEDYIGGISTVDFKATLNDFNETYLNSQIIGTSRAGKNFYYLYSATVENNIFRSIREKYYDYQSEACQATYYFNPVVTLNNNIKIKSYKNCSDGSVRGSKECPYELVES